MFNECHVGGVFSNQSFSIFPIIAIQKLWKSNFNDAQSLLLGYLLLRTKYDDLRKENYEKGVYEYIALSSRYKRFQCGLNNVFFA